MGKATFWYGTTAGRAEWDGRLPQRRDPYDFMNWFLVRRTRARRWSRTRPRPWCYSRRSTGYWSGRRSPGRCRANCCRRRRTWRRSRGRRRRLLVKVSRTLPGIAAYRGMRRADQRSDAVPSQCGSKIVIHRSVAGNERVGLAPVSPRFGEQIGFALIGVATRGGSVRADKGPAAFESNRIAEVSVRRAVTRSKLLSLTPTAVRFGE